MKCRIFIVDDHPIVIVGLKYLFGEHYEVVGSALNGQNCLAQIASANADILLVDLAMPELGGIGVLRALRNAGSAQKIVIFASTISDGDLVEALRLQIDGILLKDAPEQAILLCLDAVHSGQRWIDKSLMQRALSLTLQHDASKRGATPFDLLSLRERSVAKLIAEGLRNQEIAREINVSEATVKSYATKIYFKLGARNRADVARIFSLLPSLSD